MSLARSIHPRLALVALLITAAASASSSAWAQGGAVAVYSGTFDPPHTGHEAVVRAIQARFRPDAIYVIPNVFNSHKVGEQPYAIRRKLCEAAFGEIPGVKLPDETLESLFAEGDMPSVLREVRSRTPGSATIYHVMGDDSFARLTRLKEPVKVANRVIVVVPREYSDDAVPDSFRGTPVVPLDLDGSEPPDISSTEIRRQLAIGKGSRHLSAPVLSLIRKLGLYR